MILPKKKICWLRKVNLPFEITKFQTSKICDMYDYIKQLIFEIHLLLTGI